VTGVVQLRPGATHDEAKIRAHVHSKLAGYKTPKRILEVETIGRAPNGKADYAYVTDLVRKRLGV